MSRHFEYTLASGSEVKINQRATYVRCVSGAEVFQIEPKNQSSHEIQEGLAITFPQEFNQLTVKNTSASTQTIKLYVGFLPVDDNRSYGAVDSTLVGQNDASVAADSSIVGAGTETIAANTLRRRLLVQADIANPGYLRVGPGADATTGIVLTPGASYEFFSTVAHDVYNASGTNTYRYLEENNT